jgi:uncharacterized membrane protein YfcA
MKRISGVLKKDWYILLIILASILLGAYFYPRLPQKVPIHWVGLIVILVIIAVIPVAYSYLSFRKIKINGGR